MSQAITHAALQAATQMAASGHYRAASNLLDAFDSTVSSVHVHLLRAKIAAQQGRYDDAIAHWREALLMVPDNREAQQGIKLAQGLKAKRGAGLYLRANLYYSILLLAVAGLVALLLLATSRKAGNSDKSDSTSIKAVLEAQERQIQLSREILESLKPTAAKDEHNENKEEEKLAGIRIDVPGVSARNGDDGIRLQFERGLFESGSAKPTPEAMKTLLMLGRQLEPHTRFISVAVIGHTDNVFSPAGGKYRDNAALALARAVAVVEFLRTKTQLDGGVLSASGPGESAAPYTNDTADDRARNRTVVVWISKSRK
jgi:type VI secretion system protein ImpK